MTRTAIAVASVGLLLGCSYVEGTAPAPATTSTTPTPTTTTAPSTTTNAPAAGDPTMSCPSLTPTGPTTPSPALAAAIYGALAHPAWAEVDVSASVWVEGLGEVVAIEPDRALLPASNQKLFTAFGAHLLLDPDLRFRTDVVLDGRTLVLRAGGDPTLRSSGPHSLDALARQVADAGIDAVAELVVDASHFEDATTADGWQDWHIPTYVGPMSALMVDDNRGRADAAFLDDPAVVNLERFAESLARAGVAVERVAGRIEPESYPADIAPLATLESASIRELVDTMLGRSDNEIAESILREVGGGSTAAGVARIDAELAGWCTGIEGRSGDGSGLSRSNLRSAREWRALLQVAAQQPWGDELRSTLPVAGRSGTLARRLGGSGVAGNVSAKTGSIIGGRALSGYATATDGRAVVFSIVVNGEPSAAAAARSAIDGLVTAVVAG